MKESMKTDNANTEQTLFQELKLKLQTNGFKDYEFELNSRCANRLVDMIVTKDDVRVMAFEFKANSLNIEPLIEQFGAYDLEIPLYLATLGNDNELSIREYKNGQFEIVPISNITPRYLSSNLITKAVKNFERKSGHSKKVFNAVKVDRRIWYIAASLCLIYLISSIITMNTKCLYLPLDMSVIIWILVIVLLSLIPHILDGDDAGKHLLEVLRFISELIY